jgi:hypothetical protein
VNAVASAGLHHLRHEARTRSSVTSATAEIRGRVTDGTSHLTSRMSISPPAAHKHAPRIMPLFVPFV